MSGDIFAAIQNPSSCILAAVLTELCGASLRIRDPGSEACLVCLFLCSDQSKCIKVQRNMTNVILRLLYGKGSSGDTTQTKKASPDLRKMSSESTEIDMIVLQVPSCAR